MAGISITFRDIGILVSFESVTDEKISVVIISATHTSPEPVQVRVRTYYTSF
jgi:hypothetical protein